MANAMPGSPTKPIPNSQERLELLHCCALPSDVAWQAAGSSHQHWFVVGKRGSTMLVARGNWTDRESPVVLEFANLLSANDRVVLCSAAPQDDGPVFIFHTAGLARAIANWQIPGPRNSDDTTPDWLPRDTTGLCRQPGVVWVMRDTSSGLVIEVRTESDGRLLHTEQIMIASYECRPFEIHPFFCDPGHRKYIAIGSTLHMPHYENPWSSDRGPIQSISGIRLANETRLALTFLSGVTVLWDDGQVIQAARLSDDYELPVASFTGHGDLIVADASACDVFSTEPNELRFLARGPDLISRPVAVLPGHHGDQFALVTADGRVRLSGIPRR